MDQAVMAAQLREIYADIGAVEQRIGEAAFGALDLDGVLVKLALLAEAWEADDDAA